MGRASLGPHLRRQADVVITDKAGVRVVLDVFALNVVLQVEKGLVWSFLHLDDAHLHDVHLVGRQRVWSV